MARFSHWLAFFKQLDLYNCCLLHSFSIRFWNFNFPVLYTCFKYNVIH